MKRRLIATFFTALSLVSIPLSGPAADESAVSDYLSGENHAARLADPQPILLAQADAETAADTGGSEASGADAPLSPECAAFAKDKDADLGEVMKAGCEPTLAQMSALMDNPLGNVAMWFNQIDQFFLENDATGRGGNQTNYMGILQFPKGVSENWNLINRVVYNVVSSPLDH
jgi:hypothetical protein